jgi:hypothetical protein
MWVTGQEDDMKPTTERDRRTDRGLAGMMALFREESYFRRISNMFRGLRAPRDTRDYKAARIELQRLAAPTSALVVPALAMLLLAMLAVGRVAKEGPIITWFPPEAPLPPLETIREPPPVAPTPVDAGFNPVAGFEDVVVAVVDTPRPHETSTVETFITANPVSSPVYLPNLNYTPRAPGARPGRERDFKADPRNDTVVLRALRWLKKNQQPDGSWREHKSAMTGLAVLTFLAHDERPGHSPEFGETVQKGIEYLLRSQDARGFFAGNYEGLIASYALCEAAGMTQNPNVKQAAEKAVAFIIAGQHASGGFDYGVKPGDRDDTSVMGWAAQALKAAKIADLRVEGLDRAVKLAVRGFRKNAAPNGGFGYTGPGRGGLSGVGTLALQMLGAPDADEVQKTLSVMDDWQVSWRNPVVPGSNAQYYFYYATQVMFHVGGKRWERWNEMMKATYLDAQKVQPQAIADATGRMQDIGWWENGDQATDRPVMDTCLASLQLMVYYRYLPTFQPPVVAPPADTARGDERDLPVHSGTL